MSEGKTVRVRILVAVDTKGVWTSAGWGPPGDADDNVDDFVRDSVAMDDRLGDERRHSWVTADVPLPDSQEEIPGQVEGEPRG